MGGVISGIEQGVGSLVQGAESLASNPAIMTAVGSAFGCPELGELAPIISGLSQSGGSPSGQVSGMPVIGSSFPGALGGGFNNPFQGIGNLGNSLGSAGFGGGFGSGGFGGGGSVGGFGGGGSAGGFGGGGSVGGFGGGGSAGGGDSVGGTTAQGAESQAFSDANQAIQEQEQLTHLSNICAEISKALQTEQQIVSKAMS